MLQENWNKPIIPLHKKGDKLKCNNYRGFALLNIVYKVFSGILLKRLQLKAEECIGEYKCGNLNGKSSTVDRGSNSLTG
ncbi:Hypothetical protein CINCED_3A012365 [Cinara cedri]|uniref:Reverse transcriptase domain n=1 Tax=Cinara cedri TaxID=506608 RepID=A0A5E4NRX3_9HEMI|nr:Hypothetical protein CINCED_3A012365 [Cinara cedri]